LNVQVESTTGVTGITGKSKTKHPRVPRGLLFLNTQVKNALNKSPHTVNAIDTRPGRPVRLFGYGEFRAVTRTSPEEFNVNNVDELAASD
jgi:hypothetical protein